jgi:hypothetical protein
LPERAKRKQKQEDEAVRHALIKRENIVFVNI